MIRSPAFAKTKQKKQTKIKSGEIQSLIGIQTDRTQTNNKITKKITKVCRVYFIQRQTNEYSLDQ